MWMSSSRNTSNDFGRRSQIRLIAALLGLVVPIYVMAGGQADRNAPRYSEEFPIFFVNITGDVLNKLKKSSLPPEIHAIYDNIEEEFRTAKSDGFESLGFYWISSDMLCKLYGVRSNRWPDSEHAYVTLEGCIIDDLNDLLQNATLLKLAVEDSHGASVVKLAEQMRDTASDPDPAILFSGENIDINVLNFEQAEVFPAGPDAIYMSNIGYNGVPYSALLRHSGGTSATLEAVYGPADKLIPDSVGLSQAELAIAGPATVEVSNVEVGGVGYAGTLEYAGGNQLRVTGIRRVTLPPTEGELARAEAAAATAYAERARDAAAAAMADADAANAKVAELNEQVKKLTEGIPLVGINPGLLNLESARLTIAGPDSIYLSGIQYAGKDVSTRIRYSQGTGTVEAVFESTSDLADVLNIHAAQVEVVGDALVVSNVGIRGRAHTLTLTFTDRGGVDISARDDGWAVRTVRELRRDKLIVEGTYLVNGFANGEPMPNEGAWSEKGGAVVQTDSGASYAKFTIPAAQSGSAMLFGVTAKARDSDRVGFGLHFLASGAPNSGVTEGYGRSYLVPVH